MVLVDGLRVCAITFELAVCRHMDGSHTTTVDHRYRPTLAYTHLCMAMCDGLGLQLRKKHFPLRRAKATMSTLGVRCATLPRMSFGYVLSVLRGCLPWS